MLAAALAMRTHVQGEALPQRNSWSDRGEELTSSGLGIHTGICTPHMCTHKCIINLNKTESWGETAQAVLT